MAGAKNLRKEIITKARTEAGSILGETNRMIENTIRQIRETQAEKEKTREARQKLEEFREQIRKETLPPLIPSEEKMVQLAGKAKKLRSGNEETVKEEQPGKNIPLSEGDTVRMYGLQFDYYK